jgi:glyoxylase-like metal-dependent hydrolase (beta-lactamase superfamily II)
VESILEVGVLESSSHDDPALASAAAIVTAALVFPDSRPVVHSFFDEATFTATHIAYDARTGKAAIIDPVLDFEMASGRTAWASANAIIAYVETNGLMVEWLLETHVHADHLSAGHYLRQRLGGRLAIGRGIAQLQASFGQLFNMGTGFERDGSEFDRLFDDGEAFHVGRLRATVLHVPGHTPADLAYVIGDSVFCGDTLFMPDYGTARADFPGGDARQLYRSIRRVLSLPRSARLWLCHDYKGPGRDNYAWETTVGMERDANVHVHDGVSEDAFTAMRIARDATLPIPKLILPSIQVNLRAGRLPEPEANGTRYLKIPLNVV